MGMKHHPSFAKFFVVLGILMNLSIIFYFKYWNFVICDIVGLKTLARPSGIPIGISFYTFTQISFLVDCYKNKTYKNDIVNYALFVVYFPHLMCGPIMNFKSVYPQLTNATKFSITQNNVIKFLTFFSIGLFKKCFLADSIAETFASKFDNPLLDVPLYAFQLYFDFSGYSDMAVGLSSLFGIDIPINFNAPYKATSIIDFWRRWHISLSNFLRDYVYIPLGGKHRRFLNVIVTMVMGGLWHGASYNFLWWGLFHGVLLAMNHGLRMIKAPTSSPSLIDTWGRRGCTFILVSLGWVVFASPDMESALNVYRGLLSLKFTLSFTKIFYLGLSTVYIVWVKETKDLYDSSFRSPRVYAILVGIAFGIGVLCLNRVSPFLYEGF
jgi:D-alanyl-lipoteichoic acid acyltransferase DltB (MBOAT superfamily)